jgi:hypothetical protein
LHLQNLPSLHYCPLYTGRSKPPRNGNSYPGNVTKKHRSEEERRLAQQHRRLRDQIEADPIGGRLSLDEWIAWLCAVSDPADLEMDYHEGTPPLPAPDEKPVLVKLDHHFVSVRPSLATTAAPGSPAKLAVLCARARRGLGLWVPGEPRIESALDRQWAQRGAGSGTVEEPPDD